MPERNRFLRGLSAWSGFRAEPVDYVRDERAAGKTKYSLKKMVKLAGDGAVSFSNKPLKAPLLLGILLGFVSFAYLVVAIVLCALGIMALMHVLFAAVFLVLSAVLLCLGIFGLYLGRIYDEAKQRPLYIIDEQINF